MKLSFFIAGIFTFLFGGRVFPQASEGSGQGWARFADPTLDSLILLGASANPDLPIALSRVEEARLRIGIAESYLAPSVRANPLLTTQSLAPNRPVAFPVADLQRFQLYTFSLPVDLSYELDIFQRLRKGVKLAEVQAQISQSDYQALRLTVASEIARLYVLIRASEAEQGVFGRSLAARDSVLAILRERFRVGLTNEIDVKRAETERASLRAQQLNLERARTELVNALAGLLGAIPARFRLLPKDLGPLPEPPFSEIPTESLRKRPDLVQADQQVLAAQTGVELARANRLPRLSLSGSAGLISGKIERWFLPSSAYYLLGAGAAIPIYEGHRARQNETLARQQRTTAQEVTPQRLLTAQREAQTAFDNLRFYRQQTEAQMLALQTARQTERLTRELYVKGLSLYLDVLDAQRTAFDAERTLVQLRGQQYLSTVLLIKALGGDW